MPPIINLLLKTKDGKVLVHPLDMKHEQPWDEQPYRWTSPPRDAERYYFLGIPTTKEQLVELDHLDPIVRTTSRHESAAVVLRKASGYKYLYVVRAEPQTDEEKELAKGQDGIDLILLWVGHRNHFTHYPTNLQVYKLVEILGKLPAWYRDCYERGEFYRHKVITPR